MVIAIDGQHAFDGDAGRVHRHQDHALLLVALGRGVGLAHHDRDLAARIADARRPPFAAVDDVMIAVTDHRRFDVGCVGRGNGGLGHQEGGADVAVHQRPQPLLLLLARAVAVEDLHVAGVGRRAVEHFRRPADPAHFLGAQGVFEVGELRAFERERVVDMGLARVGRHEEIPQAGGLRLRLALFDDRDHLPALALMLLRVMFGLAGADFRIDELADAVAEIGFPLAQGEVHGASLQRMFGRGLGRTVHSVKSHPPASDGFFTPDAGHPKKTLFLRKRH